MADAPRIPEIVDLHGVKIDVSFPQFSPRILDSIRRGSYEAPEAQALLRLLSRKDRLVEIGAGCGFISSLAFKIARPESIVAVEANPAMIPIIERTFDLNGVDGATIENEVLSESGGGFAQFGVSPDFWSSRTVNVHKNAVMLEVRRTSFRERMEEWNPTLVVMDIEGGETELLRIGFPASVRKLIVETHEYVYGKSGATEVLEMAAAMGFRPDQPPKLATHSFVR